MIKATWTCEQCRREHTHEFYNIHDIEFYRPSGWIGLILTWNDLKWVCSEDCLWPHLKQELQPEVTITPQRLEPLRRYYAIISKVINEVVGVCNDPLDNDDSDVLYEISENEFNNYSGLVDDSPEHKAMCESIVKRWRTQLLTIREGKG